MDMLLKNKMIDIGFQEASFIETKELELLPEVRKMCEENRCGKYGVRWSCPPYCCTLEEGKELLRRYQKALVVTSMVELEDSYDIEGMYAANRKHTRLLNDATIYMRTQIEGVMILGAGSCNICEKCTCPENPCRFPEKSVVSMEALGLMVSDVCKKAGIKYHNGVNTITYISCFLMN